MKTKYSIIVCTFNRCDILKICLDSIANLDVSAHSNVQVILVDNNSTDRTKHYFDKIANKFSPNSNFDWKYCFEIRQGLSHARNKGIAESHGEWLIFLDDECDLKRDWLLCLDYKIKAHSPMMIGGPYRGKFLPNIDKSRYARGFLERYGDSHHLRDSWLEGSLFKPGLSGGNMSIRREALEKVGLFDPDLGMSGKKIGYGEETEMQIRILEMAPQNGIFYSPDLALIHYIRPEKTNLRSGLVSCIQRAQNIAHLKYKELVSNDSIRSDLLPQIWILIRRFLALVVFAGSSFFRSCLRRDFMSRPVYEVIYSGKLQALLQVALTIRLSMRSRLS
jgi:glycosyltransferase involved in cell wall biosynthesis